MSEFGGFVLLHRKIMENEFFRRNKEARVAFEDLIMLASYSGENFRSGGKVINVQRGTVYHSINSLAARWMWGLDKTRKILNELAAEGMIEKKTAHRMTTIRVVKYSEYQDCKRNGAEQNASRYPLADTTQNNTEITADNSTAAKMSESKTAAKTASSSVAGQAAKPAPYNNNNNINKDNNTNSNIELSISAPADSDDSDENSTDNERMTDEEWYRMMEEQYGPEER